MKEETIQILKKYSQDHILNYLPKLTKDEQDKLEEQVLRINFEQLQQLYDSTKQKPYMEEKKLDAWTHNKAIRKAIESSRITPEQKTYLRTLKQ